MLCCAGILADGLHCGVSVCVDVDDTAVSGVGPLWVWPLLIDGRPPRALSSRSHPTFPLRRLRRQTCHPSAFLLFPCVILLSSSPFSSSFRLHLPPFRQPSHLTQGAVTRQQGQTLPVSPFHSLSVYLALFCQ